MLWRVGCGVTHVLAPLCPPVDKKNILRDYTPVMDLNYGLSVGFLSVFNLNLLDYFGSRKGVSNYLRFEQLETHRTKSDSRRLWVFIWTTWNPSCDKTESDRKRLRFFMNNMKRFRWQNYVFWTGGEGQGGLNFLLPPPRYTGRGEVLYADTRCL